MDRARFFSTRLSPWLLALLIAACSSSQNNRLGGGGAGGDDDGSGSGSGYVSGCAGLLTCCASIVDAATKMACISNEQTLAADANGSQECTSILTQYQTAGVCAGASTTTTVGTTGTGGGSGCAALAACCAMMSDATTKQECLMTESELAMTANGDAECAQEAMSYAAANLCMGSVTTSSTTSGGGGFGQSSSNSTNDVSSSSSTAASSVSSTGSGGNNIIPSTCDQAHGNQGCCGPDGDVYYCAMDALPVTPEVCAAPLVCGWNATKAYYGCVAAPGGVDPSNTYPINCGP